MNGQRKQSHASMLVTLAIRTVGNGGEWFVATDGAPHVTLPNPTRTYALKSEAFRQWLSREFYAERDAVPSASALKDAINTLCGVAATKPVHPVYVRVAGLENEVFLDLGDAQHTIIRIDKDGWGTAPGATPKFVRKPGMLALPVPIQSTERLDELLPRFLNLHEERDVRATIAWLVVVARGKKPFLLLVVRGPAGSAKSTCCTFVRDIIDPNAVNGGRPARDTRDLMIAANSQYIVSLDNVSFMKDDMSDDLCSLATGAGFRTRELTTDDSEKLFSVARPVVINGIPDFLNRTDLAQRSLVVVLDAIVPERRLTDSEARAQFEAVQPVLLGAVLTAVSGVLANESTRPAHLPRMAEAAVTVTAAESALGWPSGTFVNLLIENEEDTASAILDNHPVFIALKKLKLPWAGETKHLKHLFPSDWSVKRIQNEIARLDGALRDAGYLVFLPKGKDRRKELRDKRIIYITRGKYDWEVGEVAAQLEQRAEEEALREQARRASAQQQRALNLGNDDAIPF